MCERFTDCHCVTTHVSDCESMIDRQCHCHCLSTIDSMPMCVCVRASLRVCHSLGYPRASHSVDSPNHCDCESLSVTLTVSDCLTRNSVKPIAQSLTHKSLYVSVTVT